MLAEASVLASELAGDVLRSAYLIFRALMEPTVFCLGLITMSYLALLLLFNFTEKLNGGPSVLITCQDECECQQDSQLQKIVSSRGMMKAWIYKQRVC